METITNACYLFLWWLQLDSSGYYQYPC